MDSGANEEFEDNNTSHIQPDCSNRQNMNAATDCSSTTNITPQQRESCSGNASPLESDDYSHRLLSSGKDVECEGSVLSGITISNVQESDSSEDTDNDSYSNSKPEHNENSFDYISELQGKENSHNEVPPSVSNLSETVLADNAFSNIPVHQIGKTDVKDELKSVKELSMTPCDKYDLSSLSSNRPDIDETTSLAFQTLRIPTDMQNKKLSVADNHVPRTAEHSILQPNEVTEMDTSYSSIDYLKFPLRYSSPCSVVSSFSSNTQMPEPAKNNSDTRSFNLVESEGLCDSLCSPSSNLSTSISICEQSTNSSIFRGISTLSKNSSLQTTNDQTKVSFSFPTKSEQNYSFGVNNDFSNLPASKNSVYVNSPSSNHSKNMPSPGPFKFEIPSSDTSTSAASNAKSIYSLFKTTSNITNSPNLQLGNNTKDSLSSYKIPKNPMLMTFPSDSTLFNSNTPSENDKSLSSFLPSTSTFTSTTSSASTELQTYNLPRCSESAFSAFKIVSQSPSVLQKSSVADTCTTSDTGKSTFVFRESGMSTTESSSSAFNSTNASVGSVPAFPKFKFNNQSCSTTLFPESGIAPASSASSFPSSMHSATKKLYQEPQLFNFSSSESFNKKSESSKPNLFTNVSKPLTFNFGSSEKENKSPFFVSSSVTWKSDNNASFFNPSSFSSKNTSTGTVFGPSCTTNGFTFGTRPFVPKSSSASRTTSEPSHTTEFSFGISSSFLPTIKNSIETTFFRPSGNTTGFNFPTRGVTSNTSFGIHGQEKQAKHKTQSHLQGKLSSSVWKDSSVQNSSSIPQTPFRIVKDRDVCVKHGVTESIEVRHQHITAMPEYSSFSFEELRFQHEKYNKKPYTETTTKSNKKTQTTATATSLDEEDYFSEMWKMLECPVCLEIVQPPVLQCEHGHHVCNNCWKKVTSCPLCKRRKTQTRNFVAETMIDKLPLPCKYRVDGCMKTMRQKEKISHEEVCSYRTYSCLADGCTWAHSFKDMVVHLKASHNHLLSGTQFCSSQGDKFSWTLIKAAFQKLIHAFDIPDWGLFFLRHKESGHNTHLWLQMLGCGTSNAEYYYSVEVADLKEMRSITYKGPVLPLHAVINENQDCLILAGHLLTTLRTNCGLHIKICIWRN